MSASASPKAPLCLVVMGVSGCGKSTVGAAVAHALSLPFIEGDDLHPEVNRDKMRAGIALNDDDRWPWLDQLGAAVWAASATAGGAVASCSALRRSHRDRLRSAVPGLRFIHLSGSHALIADRLRQRSGHFMPASLLDSQFATLEPPAADETDAIAIGLGLLAAPMDVARVALLALCL